MRGAGSTLDELAEWMAINGEAIHGTRPVWPYQWGELFLTGSAATNATYVLIPATRPAQPSAVESFSADLRRHVLNDIYGHSSD